MATRKEKSAATRQKLLDATMQLIHQGKLENIRVEDITEAAGVAKGTFYVYFDSKTDIIHELELAYMPDIMRFSVERTDNVPECLGLYMRFFLKLIMDFSLELFRSEMKLELDGEKGTMISHNRELFRKILTEGGYRDNPELETCIASLSAYLHGLALEWVTSNGTVNPDDVFLAGGNTLISGLLSGLEK